MKKNDFGFSTKKSNLSGTDFRHGIKGRTDELTYFAKTRNASKKNKFFCSKNGKSFII